MNNPSPAYLAALEDSKQIHKGKTFTGRFLRPHAPFVKEIIDRLGIKTVLDYGCGKGQQYEWVMERHGCTIEEWWGVKVTKYDPAYPPFAAEPEGTFDLVICTQVLGSIPVSDRAWVIDRLYGLSTMAIYVSERLGGARKVVGDNSQRGADWTEADWVKAMTRPEIREVTLATRVRQEDDQKITSHIRSFGGDQWYRVEWPEGVKALNHKWA